MNVGDFQNQNMNINDSNKPTNANSEIKITMKNIDNNINYSDSDEENNYSNENQNNGNSYQDESELNKEKKSKSDGSEHNSLDNSYNSSNFNNINNVNKNNMDNKPLDNSFNQPNSVYTGYLSDPQLTGYSNFFINNYKEALSGDNNYGTKTTFYKPVSNKNVPINRIEDINSKYNNINNNNIIESNPMHNFSRNLNRDFYTLKENKYHTIDNYNINSKKLPNQILTNQNQSSANPYLNNNNKLNDLSLPMNYGALNRNNQFNQINNQPLNFEQAIKQNQLNNLNNNRDNNNGRITIVKKLPPITNDSEPKNNINQINSITNNNLLGNNNNNINVIKLDNNGIPIENDRNIENQNQNSNNINNNNMPQNDVYNPTINQQNNKMFLLDATNNNINYLNQNLDSYNIFNPNRPTQVSQINQQINNPNQLLSPNGKKSEDFNSIDNKINSEDIKSVVSQNAKKNIDISFNDFDGSGWVKNYGGVSRPGKNTMGKQKINQDAIVSITNINDIKDFNIFGILDGHGPHGHYVSEFASEFIPLGIINNTEIKALKDPEQIYEKLKENNCQIITNAFLSCDEALKNVDFDVLISGSTCVIIIHIGTHIICANVGDSRGIIAYDDEDDKNDPELNELEFAQLSLDYKPDLPDEKNRILLNGGVVEKMKNGLGVPVGPFRVWVKGTDYPGLAMSRSIGDFKAKSVGVIAEPGIMEYDLCEASKYIVICSDGVWEYLNNEIVKDFGKTFYLKNDPSGFCHHVVNNSVVQWEKNQIIIDDISIVVVFF